MDEQTTRAQEAARQSQEAARRTQQQQQQRARESANEATRVATQMATLGTEAFAVWADVTQNAMRNMFELSSHTMQEGARQMAEWQRTNMDVVREMQNATFRWSTAVMPEALPMRWYQRSLEESVEATQRLVELGRRNAESMMQGYQRLGSATEDTTKTLGETFREAATKMQDVYARSDRLRAA
jgi:D-mannonate dehydratase